MKTMRIFCFGAWACFLFPGVGFSLTLDGLVGPVSSTVDGQPKPIRVSRDGSVVTQAGHGKIAEAAFRERTWTCGDLGEAGAGVLTQAGLSATTPMLTLYNPTGSGRGLVLLETVVISTGAPAAASGLMLAYNAVTAAAPTGVTLATTTNVNGGLGVAGGGGATPVASCYRIATLAAAPVAFRYFGGTTGAAAISGTMFQDNVDGRFIVPPGMAVSIQTTSAQKAMGHFVWEEINYP